MDPPLDCVVNAAGYPVLKKRGILTSRFRTPLLTAEDLSSKTLSVI
jgi:hypothetical protein